MEAQNQTQATPKKVLGVIKTVLVWIILVVSVFMMVFTIISKLTFNQADRNVFGYKFMIVLSDSMSKTHFDAGDVVIVKEVDKSTLKEGDVISFISQNEESFGQTITHMIKEVTTDANGDIAFVTYGTTKGIENADKALATMIIGKYQSRIPKLGYFFQFIGTVPGYLLCILLPFALLMISQGINTVRLFRRYRAEQMAGLVAERERLEAEREANRKMMEELMALKNQMQQNTGSTDSSPTENREETL